ncbi:hypothetical protein CVT25_001787 [Psilocybe cyanescens]|uniref:Uncharacterized protein n=1 Tax=Psilocybe cyanescens TaxID=93625 RepID=A0A409WPM8_PSICY|nr:hypothetical protein CVT25_001787 [Psilocybe cyanescens]
MIALILLLRRDPQKVKNGYTTDSIWRNRDKYIRTRRTIESARPNFRIIAVQFWYKYHDTSGQWYRAYGLEDWTLADNGLTKKRQMSANDVKITRRRDGLRTVWT